MTNKTATIIENIVLFDVSAYAYTIRNKLSHFVYSWNCRILFIPDEGLRI